jgi:hypothetical protein
MSKSRWIEVEERAPISLNTSPPLSPPSIQLTQLSSTNRSRAERIFLLAGGWELVAVLCYVRFVFQSLAECWLAGLIIATLLLLRREGGFRG